MDFDLGELVDSLKYDTQFDEIPVGAREFVTSEEYLNQPELSEYQYKIIEASTQIYREETLIALYGEEEGKKRFRQTYNEIIMQLGKGAGKDFVSTISCSYLVYLLLCLKDPAGYFNKPPGDAIDIINIAINAQQAKNVFFKGFLNKIHRSKWFAGKYSPKSDSVEFDKAIVVYSGHSERESLEGLNVIFVVLDEISGFAVESNTGNLNAKTSEEIYKMWSASVTSRFPDFGKLLILSFPRHKGDFITTHYNRVVADKEVIKRSHTYKIDPEMPDGIKQNEFDIEWDEDNIIKYVFPKVFALRRPSWEVNPTRSIEDYKRQFMTDPVDSYTRFLCMPPDSLENTYFGSREKLENAFRHSRIMVDENGVFAKSFRPDPSKRYYMHVDLAQVQDRCAVSMAHVSGWQEMKIMDEDYLINPKIVVDFVRYWTPTKNQSIDITEVKDFISAVRARGFDIGLVTFDRWGSVDMIKELNAMGIKAENLSLQKKHYDDFKLAVYEDRVAGPNLEILIDELSKLIVTKNNKVDHIRGQHNDLSEAVAGAIYNATAYTPRYSDSEVEVVTLADLKRVEIEERTKRPGQPIEPPKRQEMPSDIQDYLRYMKVI